VSESFLAMRSALATVATPGRHGAVGSPGVTLSELGGLRLASLAARDANIDGLRAALEREFGATLPSRPGRSAQGAAAFVWSGRNQWLAVGEASSEILGRLTSCAGELGYVTDITGSRTIVRIRGPRARDGLMKLLPIDLDEETFGADAAASTVAFHMPVQIWRIDEASTYEIACSRSYGPSLWKALLAAFAEYGCETRR
jgi:heterotetrameric sarcosine oxidase gamma subunit